MNDLAADRQATLHMIGKINLFQLKDSLTTGMSEESKKNFKEQVLCKLTLEYTLGPPGPGFAEPADDPDPTKSDESTRSNPLISRITSPSERENAW